MLHTLRTFVFSVLSLLPLALADSLSYWERQGIININFDEPVVTRTVVDNQHLAAAGEADKGLDLFTISGDDGHRPRVLWVDQDCLRIEPTAGTSVKTEFVLQFKPGTRYQSGRRLQQYEYRFRAPATPLVHEDLRSYPNGAALVTARYQNTHEARTLNPQSGLKYTFTRLKMNDQGDFFESGETAGAIVEQAQLRHGNSFNMLRSLAQQGVKWEELNQNSPLPGYVVVRPTRPLPAGSIWRLNAKAEAGSGFVESNLGPIYVNRYLSASLEQNTERNEESGAVTNTLELRFNAMVEKERLQEVFRTMKLSLDGVETVQAEDGVTRTATVNGRELRVRYQGPLEGQSYTVRPTDPDSVDVWEDDDEISDVLVKYSHPTASPGMKLVLESAVPVLAECTVQRGLAGTLGLPLLQDFTCRCNVTPVRPALADMAMSNLPLQGCHKFSVDTVNGSTVKLRVRHWNAASVVHALPVIARHLEQQERRSDMGYELYSRAVTRARINAGLATEEEMRPMPEGHERAWEVYHNRIFLQGAGGNVVAERQVELPETANPLVGTSPLELDMDALCVGQPKPGLYMVEMDFHPSAAVAKAARELGMKPEDLVLRHDVLVSVSDLAAFSFSAGNKPGVLVLRHSDGSVVQGGEAVLVGTESVSKPVALQQGFAALPEGEGDILVRQGEDFCLLRTNAFYSGVPDDGAAKQPELRAMVWTDRNLYRPGEKVYVRGFLRAVDGKNNIAHSQHRELELNFDAPDGRRLFNRVFNVDEFGAFSQELTLPEGEEDVCGGYRIRVGTTRPRTLATTRIRCEVFRRDSYEVSTEDATPGIAPMGVEFRVKAVDFNGKPVTNGQVELRMTSDRMLPGARVEGMGDRKSYELELKAPLSADGTAVFRHPFGELAQQHFHVTYEGSVVNDREEYRRFYVHKQYAPADATPRISQSGRLRLECSDCGKPYHNGLSVKVTLRGSRKRTNAMPNGFAITGMQEEEIWSGWVNVPADQEEGVQLPVNELMQQHAKEYGNSYVVEVMGRDPHGRVFCYKIPRWNNGGRGSLDEFSVSLQSGSTMLEVFSEVDRQMLLVIGSAGSYRAEMMEVQRGRHVFAAPLQANECGALSILVVPMKRDAETGLLVADGHRTVLRTQVPDLRSKLNVELQLPGTVRPGSLQMLSGRVTRPDGSPSQSVVTLYAVDKGMLSQTGYAAPDVAGALSEWRNVRIHFGAGVNDWKLSRSRLPLSPLPGVWQGEGRMADGSWKHQPWWMQEHRGSAMLTMGAAAPMAMNAVAESADFGGRKSKRAMALGSVESDAMVETVGASEAGVAETPRVRTNFNPLALWRSSLRTDAEGRFSTACTMPDTLTTYRVIAVAADKDGTRFGTGEGEFTVNQPLMLTAGTPLFMSVGDKLVLPVSVTNNTDAEGTWQVQLEGCGEPQQVVLAAGATTALQFEISPQQSGTHTCRWVATGATGQDAVQGSFPVRYPSPLLKEAHHLVLNPGQGNLVAAEKLAAELAGAPGCEVELQLSANPLLHLQGGVDFLLQQPYGNFTEWKASALLPWLLYDRLAPLCPQMAQTPVTQVHQTISRAITNLLKFQNEDGGLPMWQGRGQSNLWVSAHVAMVLRLAEERGHELPQRAWYNLLAYLEKADLKHASPLTCYEVARALQNRDAQRDALKAALASTGEAWWCSGSVRQDIEFLEYLRTNNDGRHEAFLRWMRSRAADYRHHSSWRSAWSLYALMTYVGNSPGAQVEAAVRLSDGSVLTLNRGVQTLSKLALDAPVAAQSGTVYAVLRAKAQPVQTEYPGITEKGLQMTRVYEKQGEDGIWRESKDFAVGDVVRISLTCAKTREQELNYLVLEDYLPASMEAINPAVPSQAAGLEPLNWSEYFDHREYLADRVRGFCTRWPGRDAVNLRYYARVKRAGSATAPPAQAQLFYEPQTYGLSPSARLETSAKSSVLNAECKSQNAE